MAAADLEKSDSPTGWRAAMPAYFVAAVALALTATYLSPAPFWIDADRYVAAVEQGRPVVHPPGYVGFIAVGSWLQSLTGSPYRAFQLISLVSYLASIPLLHAAVRRHVGASTGLALTLAYALNWVCLNIATVGTSHASDLLLGSILVYLASRPDPRGGWWHGILFLALVWIASFRLSSAVMAGPFLVLVLVRDFRRKSFWLWGTAGALGLAAILAWTASGYGGWSAYREASEALNTVNARSGLLSGGGWKTGGMNLVRGLGWLALAMPLLPLLGLLPASRPRPPHRQPWPAWLAAALAGSVLGVILGYLCAHPGYLAPALPALYFLAGWYLRESVTLARFSLVQVALSLALFFFPKPIEPPRSTTTAAADALFLQYTATAHRQALPSRSLSAWLLEAGREDLVPGHRLQKAAGESP